MLSTLRQRSRSDRADSSIVTFVFIMPLFFSFIVTMIDTSVYFSNRSIVQQVARDGARQVAIFGGSGTGATQSPLEARYGVNGTCAQVKDASSRTENQTEVECKVLQRFDQGSGLTNVVIDVVACGPDQALAIGATTYCNVAWTYGGVPGSAVGFMKTDEGKSPFNKNNTRVTGQSEVNASEIGQVAR